MGAESRMMGDAHKGNTCPYGCCAVDDRQRIYGKRARKRYTKSKRPVEKISWRKAVDSN